MADKVVVKLGDFVFTTPEVPEHIPFGGDQRLVVHKLVGGDRVIDALGRDDAPLTWSGLLYGKKAIDRAKLLDGYRIKGEPHTLTWSKFRYRVVVRRFLPDFEQAWQIPYTITCEVVKDEAALIKKKPKAKEVTEAGAGLEEAVKSDLAGALALATEIGDAVLSTAMDAVDGALSVVGDIASAAGSVIDTVLTPLAAAQQRVTTLIAQAGNTVANVSTLGGLLPANTISQNAQALSVQALGFTTQGKLYEMRSKLGRMDVGLSQAIGLGSAVQSVTKVGGDLFSLAADVYGDAAEWVSIAAANDKTDPVIEGEEELKIPVNPSGTGGVPDGG